MNNVPWYRFPVAHLTRCVSPLCKCHDSLDKAYHLTIWRSACLQGATSDHHSLSLGQRMGVRCHTRLLQWKIFHGANHRRQQDLPWRPGASPAELCVPLPASDALQQISASICVSRHSMRRELRGLQSWHDHLGFWHQCKQTRTHTGFRLCFFSFIVVHTVLSPAPDPKTTLLPHRTQTKPSLPPSFLHTHAVC